MLTHLVRFGLRQRLLVLIGASLLLAWGAYAFTQLPIEAYPDPLDPQVQVIAQWPGHAAEEVERQITIPLEVALNGTPQMIHLRSRSLFGLSAIYVSFDERATDYFARAQVLERITGVNLPTGVTATMSPMSAITGEIFRYTLVGAPLMELKTIEDWVLEREFKSVPGVADVNSFGGYVKEYQVEIHPERLKAYGVTLANVETAITNANANAGGNVIARGAEANVIREIGLLRSTTDIGNVVVAANNGTPVRVRDVADVHVGHRPRLGKVGIWQDIRPPRGHPGADRDDVVEGIVLLRRGENPGPTLEAIHQKVQELNTGGRLPVGVRLIPYYDRTELVHTTSHTVLKNLTEGMLLVVAVLFLFLGNVRAAVITSLTIPVALLFAGIVMGLIRVPANLLSLGAIDFGVIVNGAVIMVENLYRRLAQRQPHESAVAIILQATREVQSEILFTTLIIITAYLPLFTMQSVEKKMFAPMAYTISLALVGSLIMALLVAPVLCLLLLRGRVVDREPRVFHVLKQFYRRTLQLALRYPILTVGLTIDLFILAMIVAPSLGTEFLPHLDEGNEWVRVTMPQTISYTAAAALVPKIRAILARYQPVKTVLSQLGRPDDGTDPTGFYNAEFLVDLKPYDEWQGYHRKAELVAAMDKDLRQIPGIQTNFSQYIEDNVEEAVTGVKGVLAVKLFGDDLNTLEKKAAEVQQVLANVRGVVDTATYTETGEPQIQIEPDRAKLARYGLNIQDIQDIVTTAIGGNALTQMVEGERQFDIVARFARDSRHDINAIRGIRVSAPDGSRIPLSQLATVRAARGASFIYREANRRFIAIKFDVRGRDLGGAVAAAQAKVAQQVKLPRGYYTVWGGEFESMQRAQRRLAIIIPVTLFIMFLILFVLSNSLSRAFVVIQNVPLALIGGIFSLALTHFHLSVSAAVGFIALFGVSVQNGVIMVAYFDQLREEGRTIDQAILEGAETRLRPVLMTALLAMIGLVPAALSTGIGSDTQKPIAIVIIGGLLIETILTLYSLPIRYKLFCRAPLAAATEEMRELLVPEPA
jgi:cobalt-zinc-cadmium resistance protein CzcA